MTLREIVRNDAEMIVRGALGTIQQQGVPPGAGPAMFEFGFWVARIHRWNELSRRTR